MRKRLIPSVPAPAPSDDQQWLDIGRLALVEVTTEDKSYPVESALLFPGKGGWRAGGPGRQTIRLVFDEPQKLSCISLVFEETKISRTQEFVLRWSPDGGRSFLEIVRQQWNFNLPGTVREVEGAMAGTAYCADISGGEARASLESLRMA